MFRMHHKYPQRYDPVFGSARYCRSEAVASIVYIIKCGYFNINKDTDEILSLMTEWDAEYCMDAL